MRPVNEDLLRELARNDGPLCLSLYLEVAAGGGEHEQIRIALKNARAAATEAIGRLAGEAEAAAAIRDRLGDIEYGDVVGARGDRVAVFVAPDLTRIVAARTAETGVTAGPRFRLAPLLESLGHTPDHAILVATKDRSALWRVSGGEMREDDVADIPASLAELGKYTDLQEKGNVTGRERAGVPGQGTGGSRDRAGQTGVPHHSMGGQDWTEDYENDFRLYANALANAAGRHLSGSNLALVIAADERLNGAIREACEYPFLAAQGVTRNPDDLDEETLLKEAAACLGSVAESRRADAWEGVEASLGRGDGKASDDPAAIVSEAARGRVACLFARAGTRLAGRFDRGSLSAETADDGPDDLIDLAICETLRTGGDVFSLGERGDGMSLAAGYRY